MDLKSGSLLVPPTVKNSSCSHPRYSGTLNFIQNIGITETIEAILILVLTLGVIGANALVIFVINNRRYAAFIHQQPRYLLTSLALNDLTIGLLITPFGLLPALFHCWPYGEIFCQIQALLRGALSQQSAVILVCMAVDRYMCALYPRRYYQHSSKKGCVAILSFTWICNLTIFGILVLPKGYYFNDTGLMACEPFYSKPSYRILATCALYFPTTMILMYCYGSSFHMSRFRLNDPTMPLTAALHHPSHHTFSHHHYLQSHPQHSTMYPTMATYHHVHPPQQPHQHTQQQFETHSPAVLKPESMESKTNTTKTPNLVASNAPLINLSMAMGLGVGMGLNFTGPANTITKKIVPIQEKNSSSSISRSMAAISLGFIVMVTPWTIQEIVTACTGSKLPAFLDFLVTWTALSNSLWNPLMYCLLNGEFRLLSKRLLSWRCLNRSDSFEEHKSSCCHINTDLEITSLPLPPDPPISRLPRSNRGNGSELHDNSNINSSACGTAGSILGICARPHTNSLTRSASFTVQAMSGNGGREDTSYYGQGYDSTTSKPDLDRLSEKYWGEILERTVSSTSLHAAMQKTFHYPEGEHYHQQSIANLTDLDTSKGSDSAATTMTTSFCKPVDHNFHINKQEMLPAVSASSVLSKFSNSEPKLCELNYHLLHQPAAHTAFHLHHNHHHHHQHLHPHLHASHAFHAATLQHQHQHQHQHQNQTQNQISNKHQHQHLHYQHYPHEMHCAKNKTANSSQATKLNNNNLILPGGRNVPDI